MIIAGPTRLHQRFHLIFAYAIDLSEAETHGEEAIRAIRLHDIVPVRQVHIHRADLDAVFLRVADDLGRCVKAHGLAVEEGRAEDVRMVHF